MNPKCKNCRKEIPKRENLCLSCKEALEYILNDPEQMDKPVYVRKDNSLSWLEKKGRQK